MTKGNKRLHGETLKKYHARLKRESQTIKGWLRGREIWGFNQGGTYVRAEHGKIGSAAQGV